MQKLQELLPHRQNLTRRNGFGFQMTRKDIWQDGFREKMANLETFSWLQEERFVDFAYLLLSALVSIRELV